MTQPWQRAKVLDYIKKANKNFPEKFYIDDKEETNWDRITQAFGQCHDKNAKDIKVQPQISLWDRITGIPLKVAMQILTVYEVPFKQNWRDLTLVDKHTNEYILWAHFSPDQGTLTVYISEANVPSAQQFCNDFLSNFDEYLNGSKGKGKGKGKTTQASGSNMDKDLGFPPAVPHFARPVRDCSEGNIYNIHKPTVLASPPLEMRESRAHPTAGRDSGNQLRNHPCPKFNHTYQVGPDKKKCRSLPALLRRKTQRAIKKANQRKTYRYIRTQALGLARQVPMYRAQDPAIGLAQYHNSITCIGYHPEDPIAPSSDSATVSEVSSYQKELLQEPHIQAFRIATLNCRGLASISNRERIVHTMQKHNIDILCIQESKVNSNSREVHDGYEMFFSSGIKDDDRSKAYDLKRSGTASRDNPEHGRIFRSSIEHLGVGIIFSKKVKTTCARHPAT